MSSKHCYYQLKCGTCCTFLLHVHVHVHAHVVPSYYMLSDCTVYCCRRLACEVVRVKVQSEEGLRGRPNGEEILLVSTSNINLIQPH